MLVQRILRVLAVVCALLATSTFGDNAQAAGVWVPPGWREMNVPMCRTPTRYPADGVPVAALKPRASLCHVGVYDAYKVFWNPRNLNQKLVLDFGQFGIDDYGPIDGATMHVISRLRIAFSIPVRSGDPYPDRGVLQSNELVCETPAILCNGVRADLFLPKYDYSVATRILDSIH